MCQISLFSAVNPVWDAYSGHSGVRSAPQEKCPPPPKRSALSPRQIPGYAYVFRCPEKNFNQVGDLWQLKRRMCGCLCEGCNPPERLNGDILDSRSFMRAIQSNHHTCVDHDIMAQVQRGLQLAPTRVTVP